MINGLSSDIERILEAGNQAPSGENCQPWHFVVSGTQVEVHLLPERDQSAYGWGQRGSYLAVGAAIENIVIMSTKEGYGADVTYFPNASDNWHVANIALAKNSTVQPDALASFVFKRASNRKSYKKIELTEVERVSLQKMSPNLVLIDTPQDKVRLGRVGSTNEEVMLANRLLHNFFFSHVNWTKEEDDTKKIGFYIKTLELPPPAQVMFKVFKNWGIMRVLAAIGFNKLVATQNAATNASTSAIGGLMIDAIDPIDFVKVGRAVERVWLTATSLGLSFQPLTGVLFFRLKIKGGEAGDFSLSEQKTILDAYQTAADIFKAGNRHIAFMFRIGKADPPSAQATRFPLVDVVTIRT